MMKDSRFVIPETGSVASRYTVPADAESVTEQGVGPHSIRLPSKRTETRILCAARTLSFTSDGRGPSITPASWGLERGGSTGLPGFFLGSTLLVLTTAGSGSGGVSTFGSGSEGGGMLTISGWGEESGRLQVAKAVTAATMISRAPATPAITHGRFGGTSGGASGRATAGLLISSLVSFASGTDLMSTVGFPWSVVLSGWGAGSGVWGASAP